MNLSEYIKALQKLEADGWGEFPVCLADWSESFAVPQEDDQICGMHNAVHKRIGDGATEGSFIMLGMD